MDSVDDINQQLEKLSTTLEMAGQRSVIFDMNERDKLVGHLCKWYCVGRTRPAFERFVVVIWAKYSTIFST